MSADRLPKPGGYNIGLKDEKLKKRLIGAEVQWYLDAPAKCSVHVACDNTSLADVNPKDFPESMTVDWKGSNLFQGYLTGYQQMGGNRLTLVFEDSLSLVKKTYDHSFVKTNSLSSVLDTVCGLAKISSDKKGDFGTNVPSFSLEGRSLFDHLQDLGNRYGFFFTADQKGDRIQLIRVGNNSGEVSIDLSKESHQSQFEATSQHLFEKLKVKYFDAKNLDATEKELGQSQLYSKIASFQEHAGYSAKKDWRTAKTSLGVHSSDTEQFEGAENIIPFALSKLALQHETLKLSCFMPGITPGQTLKVESPVAKHITAGKYFVLGAHYQFMSAVPKVTVLGVRA